MLFKNINRSSGILLIILILSFLLRFIFISQVPNGLYSDEAAYGYNAYSLLKTGRDEYGQLFPLAFKSFGDYKAPLYIYFMIPFVYIFGLTEFAVRSTSAFLGLILILLVYLISKELTNSICIALLSAFFSSVLPISLQFNRMAHENNLVVVLVSSAILFFIWSLRAKDYLFLSILLFAASVYTYHDARIFTPLMMVFLFIKYRKKIFSDLRIIVCSFSFFFILLLPLLSLLNESSFWSRPRFTVFTNDLSINLDTNTERGEDLKAHFFSPVMFHNKLLSFSKKLLSNYTKHYSFDFLFLSGDSVKIYQTINNGIVYLVCAPFLYFGLYFIFKNQNKDKWLILFWLFLSCLPSAFTRFVPSASRILIILPVLSILISYGLFFFIKNINRYSIRRVFSLLFSIFFLFNFAYFLHYYYFHNPIRYAKEWHYGMKEIMEKVNELQSNYSKVWFSKSAWGYIYPLFYLKYPPKQYQLQASLSELNEFGFGWVGSFDKYVFSDFPADFKSRDDILFVGAPADFVEIKNPLYEINYPDGTGAFYIADKKSF